MVVCLEQDADLHMAQLMPLPLTVSCFSKIQIGFTLLVPAHLGSPEKRAIKRVCVCVYQLPRLSWKRGRLTGVVVVCMYVQAGRGKEGMVQCIQQIIRYVAVLQASCWHWLHSNAEQGL